MFRNICSLLDFYCKGALHMKKILIVISAFLVFSSSFFGKNIMSAMAEEPDRAPQQKYYTASVSRTARLCGVSQTGTEKKQG